MRSLVATCLMALSLVACGQASPTGSSLPSGSGSMAAEQVLRLAYAESGTLDPHVTPDPTVSFLVRGLTWFDEDLGTVPGLAETWDVSEDGLRVTFHLRDAQYSSGEPIVADDFVSGWRRLLDPRTGSGVAFLLADVAGAAALLGLPPDATPSDAEIESLLDGLGLAAPDPRTLEVTLVRPAAYFPTAVANPALVPMAEDWITRPGATEADAFWSSGPFVLTEWIHDQRRTLEPNPSWSGEPVSLERIEMRTFPSEADAQAAFADGTIDIVDVSVPPADPALAERVVDKPGTAFWHIEFDRVRGGARPPRARHSAGR